MLDLFQHLIPFFYCFKSSLISQFPSLFCFFHFLRIRTILVFALLSVDATENDVKDCNCKAVNAAD